jgi:hypothetical protein
MIGVGAYQVDKSTDRNRNGNRVKDRDGAAKILLQALVDLIKVISPRIGIEMENRNRVKERLGAALFGALAVTRFCPWLY